MSRRSIITSVLLLMTAMSGVGQGAPDPAAAQWGKRITRYCTKHGAQQREITREYNVNNEQKTVKRIFVPVLIDAEHKGATSFVKTFLDEHSMILHARQYNTDYMHWLRVVLPPPMGVSFSKENGVDTFRGRTYQQPEHDRIDQNNGPEISRFSPNGVEGQAGNNPEGVGTRYIVLNVKKESIDHTRKFFATHHRTTLSKSRYTLDMNEYLNARVAAGKEPGNNKAGCMWFITNMECKQNGKDCNIAQLLGTKRTGSPSQVARLAVRAARNEVVPVIGVAVKSLEEFNQLNEADLLLLDPHPTTEQAIRW